MAFWLYQSAVYGLIIPILIGVYHRKFLDRSLRWFLMSIISVYVCSIISVKLSKKGINNHFMMYINASLIMLFRTLFFHTFIQSKIVKITLIFLLIAYFSGVCIDIYLHGIYMNQYLFVVSNTWATIFLLISINQILKDENIESLRGFPVFWILIGTMIFVIFDFLLSVLSAWLNMVNRTFLFLLWDYITPIFMFIRIILISVGFWITKKYAQKSGLL
jgi:hypothetical protein